MNPVIDLSKFTFVGDTLKGVRELSFELMRTLRNPLDLVTTYDNIKVDTEVGFMGEGGLIGKSSNGCDPVPQEFTAGTRVVKWTPKDWEVLLHLCYKDLDGTIAEYERKNGIKKPDFTDSDYEAIVEIVIARAMVKFLYRFLWFNDTNAQNVSEGGVITDGVDVDYFNLIDGYWKQVFTQITAHPEQRVTIAGNSGATYAQQVVTPAEAKSILNDVYYKASLELRSQSDKFILVTQNLYDAYEQSLSDTAQTMLESTQSNFIEGLKVLKIHGVEVIPVPEWDENIQAYENNGTTFNKPFRALFTAKKVLGAGFDKEGDFNNLDVWYDKDTRKVKIEAMGNGDAKLLHPALFVTAY